jgi:cellulose synthase/poly-beta-1,6-N-acetylglucosamine synthase-like glycosyltransferase
MNGLLYTLILMTVLYGAIIMLFILALRFPNRPGNGEQPLVSVIIAARNEEQNIGRLLSDLLLQDYPADRYQIIVANDGSSDHTAETVSAFAAQHQRVHLLDIQQTPAGFSPKKYALQCAVEHANGEILLATDADCRVGPKWISSMVQFFTAEVGFVIGFSQFGRAGQPQKVVERLQAFDFVTLMGVAAASTHLGSPMAASGQNLAFRRAAFDQVDGYRAIRHRVSGDDVLLMQMIRKQTRYRIVFASHPDSYVVSAPQPTWGDFLNQRNRWASNGGYQIFLNPLFFAYLMLTFSYNVFLLLGMMLFFFAARSSAMVLLCFAAKGLFEWAIACSGGRYFGRQDLLKCFPLWFVLQIPYVVLVGVMGSLGLFRWKGRQGAIVSPRPQS